MQDGTFASTLAVQMISSWLDMIVDSTGLGLQLCNRVREINEEICNQTQLFGLKTASTLSALLINNERYYIAHVGDSRIYLCQHGTTQQLTQDQTANGKLTNYIGKPRDFNLFYNEGKIISGCFLLCSDGLYKRMEHDTIHENLKKLTPKDQKRVLEKMAQYVVIHGESDNISLATVICER